MDVRARPAHVAIEPAVGQHIGWFICQSAISSNPCHNKGRSRRDLHSRFRPIWYATSFASRRHRNSRITRINLIRVRLLAPPRGLSGLLYGCAAVAVPTLVRASFDTIVSDSTFAAYYPFVLIAAMFLGWRAAGVVAIVSGLVANFLFMHPRYVLFADTGDTIGTLFFIVSSSLIIALAETLRRTLHEVETVRAREAHLNRELQHRVKNTLAVVQGMATQSFREVPEAKPSLTALQGRIRALASAHDILTGGRAEARGLPEIAFRALEPFNGGGAVSLYGPPCKLSEESCVPLVLALHELGTNAVKYGALSTAGGSVELTWKVSSDPDTGALGERLVLTWAERGGPYVQPPTRRGLGSRLLRAQPGLEDVDLDFQAEGVVCRIYMWGMPMTATEAELNPPAAVPTLYWAQIPA